MSSRKSSASQILTQIKEYANSEDTDKLSQLIAELIRIKPKCWLPILSLNDFLPNPDTQECTKQDIILIASILCAVAYLDIDEVDINQLTSLNIAFTGISLQMQAIRKKLKELSFFHDSKYTQLFRIAAFIESQTRIGMKELQAHAMRGDTWDSMTAHESYLPDPRSNAKWSSIDVYETMCSTAELVIRYLLSTQPDDKHSIPDCTKTPYSDPDIEMLFRLAVSWLTLKDIWHDVVFAEWEIITDKKILLCVPRNKEDLIRRSVANLRESLLLTQITANAIPFVNQLASDPESIIKHLAEQIILPVVGEEWDLCIDCDLLAEAARCTTNSMIAEYYLDVRGYTGSILDIRIGHKGSDISLRNWLAVRTVLHTMANVLIKVMDKEEDYGELDPMRTAVVVNIHLLADVVRRVTGLNSRACSTALDLMRFDQTRRRLEIWDQPLLPFSDNRCILAPSLLVMGHPARMLEHLLAQWSHQTPRIRSKRFETRIANIFNAEKSATAVTGISFLASDGARAEYDILVWWDMYLFIIEAKCLRSVSSSEDEYHLQTEVDNSVQQLLRRRALISTDWEKIRQNASTLHLPIDPPPADRIECIAVTNVARYTSTQVDGAIITDESTLARFFGSRMIEAIKVGKKGVKKVKEINCIRENDIPTPSEFLHYLIDPPQLRMIQDSFQLVLHPIERLREQDIPFAKLIACFDPSRTALKDAFQKNKEANEDNQ